MEPCPLDIHGPAVQVTKATTVGRGRCVIQYSFAVGGSDPGQSIWEAA